MILDRVNKLTSQGCRATIAGGAMVAGLVAFSSAAVAQKTSWNGGVTHVDTVAGPSLEGNLIGDPVFREATVYLPPGYNRNRTKRYPVVYLLHGFAADHRAFMRGPYQNLNVRISMDSLIRAGRVKEMIVVTPNARNFFDGSFYTNSPVSGNWEDFIVRDLVSHMDRNYRTIRNRTARGIAGHSMGGYGTLRIGMRHPEVFSAIYALSPCCLAEMNRPERTAGWKAAIRTTERSAYMKAGFNANLVYGIATIYTPNPEKPPFFADLPYRLEGETLVSVPDVAAKWNASTPMAMVPSHLDALRRLAIGFDAGDVDGLTDIPDNVRALDSLLTEAKVPHFAEIYPGNHGNRIRARLETIVLPFFSRELH